MYTLADAAATRAPRAQLTPVSQVPWLGLAETRVTLAGRVASSVTPVAPSGPVLVTVTL